MKFRRWIWIITLLFYCTGCTTYVPVYLPGSEEAESAPEQWDHSGHAGYSPGFLPADENTKEQSADPASFNIIYPGIPLRILLKNGEVISGELLEFSDGALVFGHPGNYGLKKTYYPIGDIKKMETPRSTAFAHFAQVFVLTSIVVLLVAGAAVAHSLRGMN